jgi:hypothetical protein
MAITKWREAIAAGEFLLSQIEAGARALFEAHTDGLPGADWATLPEAGREPIMQTSYLVQAGAKGTQSRKPVQIASDEKSLYALCRDGTMWAAVHGDWKRVPDIPHG